MINAKRGPLKESRASWARWHRKGEGGLLTVPRAKVRLTSGLEEGRTENFGLCERQKRLQGEKEKPCGDVEFAWGGAREWISSPIRGENVRTDLGERGNAGTIP